MKIRKIFAGMTAAALAASMMAVMASANTPMEKTNSGAPDYAWSNKTLISNSDISTDMAAAKADKAVFNLAVKNINYGYAGGMIWTNTKPNGWKDVKFGGSKVSGTSVEIADDAATCAVEVPFAPEDVSWYELGYAGVNEGEFEVVDVEFYSGATLIGTWADGVYKTAPEDKKPELKMIGDAPKWEAKEIELEVENDPGGDAPVKATAFVPFEEYKTLDDFKTEFGDNYEAVLILTEGKEKLAALSAEIVAQYQKDQENTGYSASLDIFEEEELEGGAKSKPTARLTGETEDLLPEDEDKDAEFHIAGIELTAYFSDAEVATLKKGDKIPVKIDYTLFSDGKALGQTEEHNHDGLKMIGDKEKLTGQEIELEVGKPDKDGNVQAKGGIVFDYTTWKALETEFGTKFCVSLVITDAPQDLVETDAFDAQVYSMDNAKWDWKSVFGTFKIDGGKAQTTVTQPMLHLYGNTAEVLTLTKTADNELGRAGIEFIANLGSNSNYKEGDKIKIKINYALFSNGEEYKEEAPTDEPKEEDDKKPSDTGAAAGVLAAAAALGAAAVVVSKKRK